MQPALELLACCIVPAGNECLSHPSAQSKNLVSIEAVVTADTDRHHGQDHRDPQSNRLGAAALSYDCFHNGSEVQPYATLLRFLPFCEFSPRMSWRPLKIVERLGTRPKLLSMMADLPRPGKIDSWLAHAPSCSACRPGGSRSSKIAVHADMMVGEPRAACRVLDLGHMAGNALILRIDRTRPHMAVRVLRRSPGPWRLFGCLLPAVAAQAFDFIV